MKVLQVTSSRTWSGGTEQCLLLSKYMNALGVKTDILCFSESQIYKRANELGIRTRVFPNTKKLDFSEAKKLASILEEYDVVNTHIPLAHWFVWTAFPFIGRKSKPKLVYTRRVLYDISVFSAFTKYNIFVDALIGISKAICEKLRKYPPLKRKVFYIPSGVELDRFSLREVTLDLKRVLGIDEDTLVITNIANFQEVKGHSFLLAAFRKVLDSLKKRKSILLLVGRGTNSANALGLIKKFNLEKNVMPLGFRKDIPEILGITDVFVFPSVEEGLGSSLLQAMAMERLVVASDAGGIKNYLIPDVNGIMVKRRDVESLYRGLVKAIEILGTPEAERLKREAGKTAKKFDIKRVAEETLKLYEEILNG